jgi:hypothetical protein
MRHEEVALPVELTDEHLEAVVGGMGLCGKGGDDKPAEAPAAGCSSC